MRLPVILGAAFELHTGLHGSLTDTPPSNVDYDVRNGIHTFVFASASHSLFSAQALLECTDYGAGPEVVHSTKWPVLNRRAWIIDYDNFAYPVFCSHYGLTPAYREREARRATRTPAFAYQTRTRFANMTRALAHPSCKRVLTYTAAEARAIESWLEGAPDARLAAAVASKVMVVSPACQTTDAAVVARKWSAAEPMRVVFCGRGFEAKRGDWALTGFQHLLQRHADVRCTYIGDIPAAARARHAPVLRRVEVLEQIPHDRVLEIFSRAHLLFHPAENESVGAVLVEAAAAGMCVVTATGTGMEQTRDWFDGGGALLVERNGAENDEERGFYRALLTLADDPGLARQHGLFNYEMARTGQLSLARRDAALSTVYSECIERPAETSLDLDVFDFPAAAVVHRTDSRSLARQRLEYRQQVGIGYQLDLVFER